MLNISFFVPMPVTTSITRSVWHFKGAKWSRLKHALSNIDWTCLRERDVDQAIELFYGILQDLCNKYIPHENLQMRKRTHPWIDDECQHVIREKNLAQDTSSYRDACAKCAELLIRKYHIHICKLKDKILKLKQIRNLSGV